MSALLFSGDLTIWTFVAVLAFVLLVVLFFVVQGLLRHAKRCDCMFCEAGAPDYCLRSFR